MTENAQPTGKDGDRLDSWKEIAAYLGKGVRTALRWSKDEGMPVYRHAGSKRGAVYAFRSEIDEWIHSDRSSPPRISRKSLLLWAGASVILILAAVTMFLWLNRVPDQPDTFVVVRPWVLFSDFNNRSGEARLDGTVETALRRELAKSRHVLVVAPERVRDTLVLMKRPPDTPIDAELGSEICLRYVHGCALLTGRVDKFGPNYLFSMEVVDPADGLIVASAEEQANGDAEILTAIQRLGVWLRNHMGEELAQISLEGDRLEKVTTPSLRALELYSHGEQTYRLYRFAEAEHLFRQAVAEDPDFASAHLFIFYALMYQGKGTTEEARGSLRRAIELAESTSEQERYLIEGTHYAQEENFEKACTLFKTMADLFPDHYWAANNAGSVCGNTLGRREDIVRYALKAEEQRPDKSWLAANQLFLLNGDFERARPYIERARDYTANQTGATLNPFSLAFTELFPAEEYLDKGLLTDVLGELQRVERTLDSLDDSARRVVAGKLVRFYLALGQFQKAPELSQDFRYPGLLQSWLAYLRGDQAAFREHLEEFRTAYRQMEPDPNIRLVRLLLWNFQSWTEGFMLDVLAPLYEPEAAELASRTEVPFFPYARDALSAQVFKAKLQLIRGNQMLIRGDPGEARALLHRGTEWFRDNGGWHTFSYYFLGSELLAVALAQSDEPEAAYRVLKAAAERRIMVNSYTVPLHQKIQARLALLARELGRITEAEAIEAELAEALALADPDHPIMVQIREHLDEMPVIE